MISVLFFFSFSPFFSLPSALIPFFQGWVRSSTVLYPTVFLLFLFLYSIKGRTCFVFGPAGCFTRGGDRAGLDLEKFRELNPPFFPSLSPHSEHYIFLCLVFGYWLAYVYGYGYGYGRLGKGRNLIMTG